MRVFVTGATGWIGSAIVSELLASGHQVTGLTTSAGGAEKLRRSGVAARMGRLSDHALLQDEAAKSDGVIHTAFIHGLHHMSWSMRLRMFAGAVNGGPVASFMRIITETERGAIRALGAGLEGANKPLIFASGVLFLPPHGLATEKDDHVGKVNRSFSENAAFALVARGVRSCAIRLAPTVHGKGDHGFVDYILKAARKKGVSPYVGEGNNRWPAVHVADAARLFRLALERGTSGAKYHGVAEEGIPFREIATSIATRLKVPCTGISPQQAAKHFGMLARFVDQDNPASSAWTQRTLGWTPVQPNLLSDMDAHYFNAPA